MIMRKLQDKYAELIGKLTGNAHETTPIKERYRQFRIILLFAITIVALIPSILLSVLGYFRFLDLADRQSRTLIRWHLEYVTNNFEKFTDSLLLETDELCSDLAPIAEERGDELNRFLLQKEQMEGMVALQYYTNDFKLIATSSEGHNPIQSAQKSFIKERLPTGKPFLTSIGEEEAPYFTIATPLLSTQTQDKLFCLTSFTGKILENKVKEIDALAMDDAFLVDSGGKLQSTSVYYGKRGNSFDVLEPPKEPTFHTVSKSFGMGSVSYASTPIPSTPWNLVLIKDGPVQKREWFTFQLSLVLIFLACAAGSFIVIHQLVNLLTIRIREADTKRMALLNEVGHTNRLATIGKLAAGVAHEINNPLAVIDQKAGLIDDILEMDKNFSNKNKLRECIGGIHSSVDRCKVITHRLLGFARKMDSINEMIDINHLIKEVLGFLEKEALFSHIRFHLQLEENLPEINSDRGQLQQIFLNIVSNSIDAIQANGNITLKTSLTKKERILVEISDDGPGITSKVMEHIFDPFFTTKKTGEGTGLGLSITYGLVKKLGGKIKVYSKVDEGVTFFIYLPIQPARGEE